MCGQLSLSFLFFGIVMTCMCGEALASRPNKRECSLLKMISRDIAGLAPRQERRRSSPLTTLISRSIGLCHIGELMSQHVKRHGLKQNSLKQRHQRGVDIPDKEIPGDRLTKKEIGKYCGL